MARDDPLRSFHPPVRDWFRDAFRAPTPAQREGWRTILAGRSTLVIAPTGSGKTLAAFLAAIDGMMFTPPPERKRRCRVLYVSPLKALAVDVERNLRAPIAGIAAAAGRSGVAYHEPLVAIRSGDTPQTDRVRMRREPPDILITTPESLFLILTSAASEMLASVDTVILDEIHSVAGTKRGAHLALSLERCERLRDPDRPPLQRIGLSATLRPVDEVRRLLGGGTVAPTGVWSPREVDVVDAGSRRQIELAVEVPVEDMSRLGEEIEVPSGPAAAGPARRSIWPSIYPRLIEAIRAHRSTMIFVNSRRLAERLAAAINEQAEEELALAHHGSVARERREVIEDSLKRGELPAIVATSSMELGIDMGAVDLVVQIEAPPSVTSGLQRIGRANHAVGEVPRGMIVPKYRGDLVACAAAAESMTLGLVEETRYPRNPLDVLAQQVVAISAMHDSIDVDALFDLVRGAAPFAELPRSSFDSTLDMLSGRYPSDEFRELRPRLTWDRTAGTVEARRGAKRIAVANAGTIPDRGLYGVFLPGDGSSGGRRVGELDEEMVFETRLGDVFLLGASSWRVEDITHDRVVVTPAPGEPGKMPFWHGDRPGRSLEFGTAIGRLCRELVRVERDEAIERLGSRHGLDERAARNLLDYLAEQVEAIGEVPSDRTIVVERFLDEVGDWRVCILSPLGAAVHAPWAMAAAARLEEESGLGVETVWSDDGMVFRVPETGEPPDATLLVPSPDDVEELVTRRLSSTALFAARFRENAARALLLPRRRPGRRNPLWIQRKRSADLLAVASRYSSFPIILETYRECLRDVFDLPGLVGVLRRIDDRSLRVLSVESRTPSPFASSLLFTYVANFIYEGDSPLAERRAQTLSIDQAQLRELLGEAELRELIDPGVVEEVERSLQHLSPERRAGHADALHDMLLDIGDVTSREVRERCEPSAHAKRWLEELERKRRVFRFRRGRSWRFAATEDAARFRDALGVALPRGLPAAFLEPVADPIGDLIGRFARTHGPFTAEAVAKRFGLAVAKVSGLLERLEAEGRVASGAFLREGRGREWCDTDVLRRLKRQSLARLRQEVEPVDPPALARLLLDWQGVTAPRRGADGLLAAIEQLEGCPIVASTLESEILPARVEDYDPGLLDQLCASGEVIWRGLQPLGPRDGRLALYLRDHYRLLAPPPGSVDGELAGRICDLLLKAGASFFPALVREIGGFRAELLDVVWDLVWAGVITNDTVAPLRSFLAGGEPRPRRRRAARDTRLGPPGSEGRWSLLPAVGAADPETGETERRTALARTLVERYGVLTREAVRAEGIDGGFAAVYDVLKALEEAGRIRRGYFVAGLGATQFAAPGADERLRALRTESERPRTVVLSATDPANPHGSLIPWPARGDARLERRAGARVFLRDGVPIAYLGRNERNLMTLGESGGPLPEDSARALARALAALVEESDSRRAVLVSRIDGARPEHSPLAPFLEEVGFTAGSAGYLKRRATAGGATPWRGRGKDRAGG